jgi:hypothetical protein
MAATMLIIFSAWVVLEFVKPPSCTIFTAVQDETVLFGNNEDYHSSELVIGFYPPTPAGYGSVHLGFRHPDGSIEFGGAVNDQGLAWDVNGLPYARLNPHPEKPYSHATDNYLTTITKQATTVAEAVRIAHKFDFGSAMEIQIHVADATGDAVVISAGPDYEMAFTWKPVGDGYLVSTNFNLENPKNGTIGWRYETATSMLAKLGSAQDLTREYAAEILNAVHLENLDSYTLYSNIFDLKNRVIYLYYMAQYDEMVQLNISDELAKGKRILEMRELFLADTVETGDSAYQRFEIRSTILKVAVIVAILSMIAVGTVFGVKKFKRGKTKHVQQ